MTWNSNMDEAPRDGTEVQLFARGHQHVGAWQRGWEEWGVTVPSLNPNDCKTFTGLGPRSWPDGGPVIDPGPSHWKPLDPSPHHHR